MDNLTLLISYSVVTFSIFLITIVLALYLKSKWLRTFSYAFASLTFGPLLVCISQPFGFLYTLIAGNMIEISGYLFFFAGVRYLYREKRTWLYRFWLYIFADLITSFSFTYLSYRFIYRVIANNIIIMLILIEMYFYLKKHFSKMNTLTRTSFRVIIIFSIFAFLVRNVVVIFYSKNSDTLLVNNAVSGYSFLLFMFLSVSWFVTVLLLENSSSKETIEKKKEQVELAIKGSNDGIWDWDIVNDKLYFSPKWKEQLGYLPSELGDSFNTFENLICDEDRDFVVNELKNYLVKNQKVFDVEFRMRHKDGRYRWFRTRGEALWDINNNAYRMAGSTTDITHSKSVEDALKSSEAKYRLIVENITDVILVYNVTSQRYSYVTPSIKQLMGYSPEEFYELKDEDYMETDTISLVNELSERTLVEFLKNPEANHTYTVLIQNTCKSGEIIWVEYYTKFRYNSKNEIETYAVARNVTERKQAEDKILYLSYHDSLTGLYNRRYLEEKMSLLDTEDNLPISIIMGDVNHLKLMNDAFGHKMGDELIIKSSEAIKSGCYMEANISRWGGDEFIVLLPKTDSRKVKLIIDNILLNCSKQEVNSMPVSVAFGFGTKTSSIQTIFATMQEAENFMYRMKSKEGERNRQHIIKRISEVLFQKYPSEEQHARRVSSLCAKLAVSLGLDEAFVKKASIAGMMHDIGKVAMGVQLIEKSAPLTKDEWEEVMQHAEVGYKIIGSSEEMFDISEAIFEHHEKYDGTGYPRGIRLTEISQLARIVTIVESYDSMTHPHSYKPKLEKDQAILEIRNNEGLQFDPKLAEIFIEKVLLAEEVSNETDSNITLFVNDSVEEAL